MRTNIEQKLTQNNHLSPQQIKAIRLLSFSEIELDDEIDKELEENPALEKNSQEESMPDSSTTNEAPTNNFSAIDRDITRSIYENVAQEKNLYELLKGQISSSIFPKYQLQIAEYLIASINEFGFLSINKEIVLSDLMTEYNIYCSIDELNSIIEKIKILEPLGCGSTNLQDYLIFQLSYVGENDVVKDIAKKIIVKTIKNGILDLNIKNNIKNQIKGLDKNLIEKAYKIIATLKTRPFEKKSSNSYSMRYFADFTVCVNEHGDVVGSLNSKKDLSIIVNKNYQKILSNPKQNNSSATINFIKSKLDRASFFIEAIKKRKETLTKIIYALTEMQKDYFLSHGDPSELKPMVIENVAKKIEMHQSTISRALTNKYIRTDFGIIPAKSLFSNKISTEDGESASNREIVAKIKNYISTEDIAKPYTDEQLTKFLNNAGYKIARRTVSKYREQSGITTSSLRKR